MKHGSFENSKHHHGITTNEVYQTIDQNPNSDYDTAHNHRFISAEDQTYRTPHHEIPTNHTEGPALRKTLDTSSNHVKEWTVNMARYFRERSPVPSTRYEQDDDCFHNPRETQLQTGESITDQDSLDMPTDRNLDSLLYSCIGNSRSPCQTSSTVSDTYAPDSATEFGVPSAADVAWTVSQSADNESLVATSASGRKLRQSVAVSSLIDECVKMALLALLNRILILFYTQEFESARNLAEEAVSIAQQRGGRNLLNARSWLWRAITVDASLENKKERENFDVVESLMNALSLHRFPKEGRADLHRLVHLLQRHWHSVEEYLDMQDRSEGCDFDFPGSQEVSPVTTVPEIAITYKDNLRAFIADFYLKNQTAYANDSKVRSKGTQPNVRSGVTYQAVDRLSDPSQSESTKGMERHSVLFASLMGQLQFDPNDTTSLPEDTSLRTSHGVSTANSADRTQVFEGPQELDAVDQTVIRLRNEPTSRKPKIPKLSTSGSRNELEDTFKNRTAHNVNLSDSLLGHAEHQPSQNRHPGVSSKPLAQLREEVMLTDTPANNELIKRLGAPARRQLMQERKPAIPPLNTNFFHSRIGETRHGSLSTISPSSPVVPSPLRRSSLADDLV